MKILVSLVVWFTLAFSAVNINTASVKDLSTLNGIGKTKAEAIIKYRKVHCFKNINELTNVKGIGKKTLEKNKTKLSASGCK